MNNSTLLSVRGLVKGFAVHHLGSWIDAFAGIDFDLSAGEFLLLTGPNGVGKSTLLRTIYRTYRPLGGTARFRSSFGDIDLATAADVDIARLRNRDIGFVTQFLSARPRVSAEDLVAEPLRRAGRLAAEARDEARRRLADFGVKPELWAAYPVTFSGGEQQKVNLARELIMPRRLLLLDEPTASLDTTARRALVRRLEQLKAEGVAMLGVFHHPADVTALIDRDIALRTSEVANITAASELLPNLGGDDLARTGTRSAL
ncbi:alpha-D-ribose 1-methylphosphonate 5-triphosphate synthase subunit PhnL [Bradyrhizobium sp. USDA 4369]